MKPFHKLKIVDLYCPHWSSREMINLGGSTQIINSSLDRHQINCFPLSEFLSRLRLKIQMCRAPTVGRTWQYNNICFPEPFLNIILPWLECQIIPHSRTCEPSLRSYIQGGARCFNYISFISFFFSLNVFIFSNV